MSLRRLHPQFYPVLTRQATTAPPLTRVTSLLGERLWGRFTTCGWGALTLVSELGSDFTKWPTVKQFCSWLGLCPNWHKTGGKVKSSHTRRGKGRAARAFRLAAWALLRSKSYLGAYLRRQRGRLGAPQAITACAHKLARIVYNLMRFGLAYVKQTESAYMEQVRERQEKQLQRRAQELALYVAEDGGGGVAAGGIGAG